MPETPAGCCSLCHCPLSQPTNWLGRLLDRVNPPPPTCPPPSMRECHRAFAERVGIDPDSVHP